MLSNRLIFDEPLYDGLNSSRAAAVTEILSSLRSELELKTAADIGCGLGYFSSLLSSLDFQVIGVEGREQNVQEARRRHSHVSFYVRDAEDKSLRDFGKFDLVLCFGLLYHLENPFLTVRNLHAIAAKLLLVEAVIFPGQDPVMALVNEEFHDDQGLNHIAFYPTESCLVKMLYSAGFPFVYGLASQPSHPHYHNGRGGPRVRTILAASLTQLRSRTLVPIPETSTPIRPWDPLSGMSQPVQPKGVRGFLKRPLAQKVESIKRAIKGR